MRTTSEKDVRSRLAQFYVDESDEEEEDCEQMRISRDDFCQQPRVEDSPTHSQKRLRVALTIAMAAAVLVVSSIAVVLTTSSSSTSVFASPPSLPPVTPSPIAPPSLPPPPLTPPLPLSPPLSPSPDPSRPPLPKAPYPPNLPPPHLPPPPPSAPPPAAPPPSFAARLLVRLNEMFAGGQPSNALADAGVLLRQFDSLEAEHRPWLPCTRDQWCYPLSDRWPASMVNPKARHTWFDGDTDGGGLIFNPEFVRIFCACKCAPTRTDLR